jgi:hypothetical protein
MVRRWECGVISIGWVAPEKARHTRESAGWLESVGGHSYLHVHMPSLASLLPFDLVQELVT